MIGNLNVLRQVEIVKPVFPRQSGYDGVAEIREAREDGVESMRRQVCADGVRMSDIQKQGCHARKTEILDNPLGGIKGDVAEADLVLPAFR